MISVRDGLQKKRERGFRVHILKIQQKEGIKRKKKKQKLRYAYTLTLHEYLRGVLRAEVTSRVKLRYACWPGHLSLAIQLARKLKPKAQNGNFDNTAQHEFRIPS